MAYAGFWLRLVAKIIDGIVLGVFSAVVGFLVTMALSAGTAATVVNFLIQTVAGFAYSIFFIGKYAATPGKMALKLKVVLPDGGKVSYARAFGRSAAEWLSFLTLLVGYIMAAFDSEKRTLHDRVAGTRVIKS